VESHSFDRLPYALILKKRVLNDELFKLQKQIVQLDTVGKLLGKGPLDGVNKVTENLIALRDAMNEEASNQRWFVDLLEQRPAPPIPERKDQPEEAAAAPQPEKKSGATPAAPQAAKPMPPPKKLPTRIPNLQRAFDNCEFMLYLFL